MFTRKKKFSLGAEIGSKMVRCIGADDDRGGEIARSYSIKILQLINFICIIYLYILKKYILKNTYIFTKIFFKSVN